MLTPSGSSSSRILVGLFFMEKTWKRKARTTADIYYLATVTCSSPTLSCHIWRSSWFTSGVSQTVITKGSEPLVTMPFSGQGCYTCQCIGTISHGGTKRHPIESPRCQTYLSPHCVIAALSLVIMSHLFLPCVDSFVCYSFDTRKQKWLDDSSACKLNETLTVCSLSGGSIITLRNQDLTTYITQGCREQKNTNPPNKSFEVIIKEATSISSPLCFMHVFSLGTQHHIKTLGLGWVLPPGSWHPPTFVGNIYKLLP